jgi:hypothetical protein
MTSNADMWKRRCQRYEKHMADNVPPQYWPELFGQAETHVAAPAEPVPGVAWVEIHAALLFCPCGHKTDMTDHVRQAFCSRAEHTCESCGCRWFLPASAECSLVVGNADDAGMTDDALPEPNEDEWTCYPCRQGEVRDLAETWRAKGHRVIVEPVRDHRRRVWVKDSPEPADGAQGE